MQTNVLVDWIYNINRRSEIWSDSFNWPKTFGKI